MLEQAACDLMFQPDVDEMYPAGPGIATRVDVPGLSTILCGEFRPGHFEGVATVVAKLFNIVQPDVAVFGEKDYQQLALIRRMVRDLFLDVDVIGAPIVREADGLAMSSRNRHLEATERAAARCLPEALGAAEAALAGGERSAAAVVAAAAAVMAREPLARVDYVALVDPETLAPVETVDDRAVLALAVWIGSTRLIDNRLLAVPAVKTERRSA